MRRHPFDVLSFVFGAVFLAFSGMLSLRGVDFYGPGVRWLGVAALILIGLGLLLASRSKKPEEDR